MINYSRDMEEYPSLAEGVGLENREAGNTGRGVESLLPRHFTKTRMQVG